MSRKYVYFFGAGGAEGDMKMKNILGGKGANLAEMAGLGLPVPPGFTVSTEVCDLFYKNRKRIPADVRAQIDKNLKKLEKAAGQTLGDSKNPLLVSIRSGARASMPGMMDTILNLGLNEKTVAALIAKTGNPRFAYDCYRRFIQMYGDVVLGLKPVRKEDVDPFEKIIEEKKAERGLTADMDLTADDLKDLCVRFKAAILKNTGLEFPEDPREQLWGAIGAVFDSWMNDRAIAYRKMYDIPEAWGTAVNVQLMVFGNMGPDSGTGVAFTRDAATGANVFYGEYLMNAQGEDVVAGIRTPLPIVMLKKDDAKSYAQLEKFRHVLEKHYADMMDIEFTIQQGKLYMLQCRVGKRTAFAAIKIAVDMVGEKLISEKEALSRIEPDQLNQLLRPIFDPAEKTAAIKAGRLLTKGLNAGPGAASGRIVFNSVDAEAWAGRGEKVILTRIETSPEDIKGMNAAEGDPHGPGRHDLPRRPCRPPDGAGLRGRLRRVGDRLRGPDGHRQGPEAPRRRLDLDRRHDRRGPRGPGPNQAFGGSSGPDPEIPQSQGRPRLPDLRQGDVLGRQGPDPQDPDQRRPARPSGQCRGLWGGRHRSLPDRAYVLRRRKDRADAGDDPGRHDRRAEGRPGPSSSPSAAGFRRHFRGHEGPPGDHPDDRPAAPRISAPSRKRPAGPGRGDGHSL
jgi:pyruvate phosphate dikinase (EC 2.7.9.1)